MGHLDCRVRVVVVTVVVIGGAACSRTGFGDLGEPSPRLSDLVDARAGVSTGGAPPIASPPGSSADPTTPGRRCEPHPEECNGDDDDCNGRVDDGIAPVPCPHGGQQYCVAGRLSACPSRCDACIPGSERVCFHSYCTFWAVESCAADGKAFGPCRERRVPPECAAVADANHESPELERCCIDNGYCCHDEFDIDGDGNRNEMLGTCDEVSCGP